MYIVTLYVENFKVFLKGHWSDCPQNHEYQHNSSHRWSVASITLWSRKLYRQMEDVSSASPTTPLDSVHYMLGLDLKAQLFENLVHLVLAPCTL